MHIPDGIIAEPVCAAAAVVVAGAAGAAWCLGRTRTTSRQLELVGPAAAVIFAAQMVNVSVGGGTSGHLIGGALAVALLGPWAAMITMALVVTVQALVFADGGVAALGINLLLMAVIAPCVAAGVLALCRRLLGELFVSTTARSLSAGLAGFVSVMAAVVGYLVIHEVGATVAFSARSITSAMVNTHIGVGLLEAAMTTAAMVAVLTALPSLRRDADLALVSLGVK